MSGIEALAALVLYALIAAIFFTVLYFVIKSAVKSAINETRKNSKSSGI